MKKTAPNLSLEVIKYSVLNLTKSYFEEHGLKLDHEHNQPLDPKIYNDLVNHLQKGFKDKNVTLERHRIRDQLDLLGITSIAEIETQLLRRGQSKGQNGNGSANSPGK